MEYARNLNKEYYYKLLPQKFYGELTEYLVKIKDLFDFDEDSLMDLILEELMPYYAEMFDAASKMDVSILGVSYKEKSIKEALECDKIDECGGCVVLDRYVVLIHDLMYPRAYIFISNMVHIFDIDLISSDLTDRISEEYLGEKEDILAFVIQNNYNRIVEAYAGGGSTYFDTVKVMEYIVKALEASPENKMFNFSSN